jgi:hypothetical protein
MRAQGARDWRPKQEYGPSAPAALIKWPPLEGRGNYALRLIRDTTGAPPTLDRPASPDDLARRQPQRFSSPAVLLRCRLPNTLAPSTIESPATRAVLCDAQQVY